MEDAGTEAKVRGKGIKVVFAGGGTGGHLMAGLSTAEEIQARFANAGIVFFGTGKAFERRCVELRGFQFKQIKAGKWESSWKSCFYFLYALFAGLIESFIEMKRFSPDIVVGLGGYVSVTPIIAAKLLGIPIVLLEQNVIPGKANRFLARWADEIYCHWRNSVPWFKKEKGVMVTGTPIRKGIMNCNRRYAIEKFGLSMNKKTILVTGGSQGAKVINDIIMRCLPQLEQLSDRLQILHCTGEIGYEDVKLAYQKTKIDAFVCKFLDEMGAALSVADIVICRAGATTIAEITAIGIPAILIPYPYAADNHQFWNAKELADNGGGILLQQFDLTPEKVIELVKYLLDNEGQYERIKTLSKKMGMPDASKNVADNICRITVFGRTTPHNVYL